jgi:cysteine desulfurase
VTEVAVDRVGRVEPADVAAAVRQDTAVVSIMTANNETGVVQPVRAIADVVRSVTGGAAIHTDAVQAFASLDLDVDDLGVDLLAIAGHKFGGPKGVGLLYVRDGTPLEAVVHGGGQELGRRSGTHNVMGAVGLATAMRLAADDRAGFAERVGAERDGFEARLLELSPDASVTLAGVERLAQHSHVHIPGIRNETLLVRLDRAGVAASAASACQSGAATISHVLEAMGYTPDEARNCMRFSFGWTTAPGEGRRAAEIVADQVEQMRELASPDVTRTSTATTGREAR